MADDEAETESDEDKQNDEWVKSEFIKLIDQYPRRWIAVLDRKVIATGSTRKEVEDAANIIADEREYSIYFIPPTETTTDAGYYSSSR